MPELPKIKKNLKGEIKGKIEGVRGGSRNDLSNPNWRLKAGKGGSPGQPYDDPEKGKGPFVPAPGKIAKRKSRYSGKSPRQA